MQKKINEKLSGLHNMGKGSHISSGLTDHLSSCHHYNWVLSKVSYILSKSQGIMTLIPRTFLRLKLNLRLMGRIHEMMFHFLKKVKYVTLPKKPTRYFDSRHFTCKRTMTWLSETSFIYSHIFPL